MSIEGDVVRMKAEIAPRNASAPQLALDVHQRLLAAAAMHEMQAIAADNRKQAGNAMGWIWDAADQ